MAPRKQKVDEKSQPLAAAAVGAGTELVQAQTEQNKDGTVLVDPAAEAARLEAEQQAAEEARLAAEAAAAAAANQDAGDQSSTMAIGASSAPGANLSEGMTSDLPDWLLGQFDVKAKSPAGFWRCQVHFLHSSPTRVFVVEDKAAVPPDHDCEIPCCYLTPEEARRVHQEAWLTVVPDSEITKE
ncbi:hypothetical protein [Aeromonas media]|uniref:hypothetical protein n=1 Tax=Aeromonas media TaxID=651 RepID=UPI0022402EB6|nr:hypothetical protein [Aeromonas media]